MDPQAANVDRAELAKFGDMAHHWWDPESELFGPLHRLNPLRMQWLERIAGGLAGQRVVDVGCGGGILAESMAAEGAQVLGIDLSTESLGVARLHQLESGADVEYRAIAAEALAEEKPGAFDLVTCMEMLEHVPDPEAIVAACARLARRDGLLVFSTLNRNPKSYALAILGAEYVLRLLPRGTHDWSRFIKPAELAGFARRAGCSPVEMTGLVYNPLSGVFSLAADDVDVNYLAAFRRDA